MTHAIAGFPERRAWLADLVGEMSIDFEALARPLRRCELASCRGTCCYDGVYLSSEESRILRELGSTAGEEWERIGLSLPERPVVFGKWRDVASGPKTAVRPALPDENVPDYPLHFPRTRCVFLLPDARCGLHVLAEDRGLHPWHFKPLTCWLHPLSIAAGEDQRPRLTLYDETSDPQRYEDYDGFSCRTHCGRTAPDGEAAWKTLEEELRTLGEVGDRDLLGEIASWFRQKAEPGPGG